MLWPPLGMALLVATSGEAGLPLGVAWLGTGDARLGGAAEPLGEADAFESVPARSSSLTEKSGRSCDTTRPTAAVAVPSGTGLLLGSGGALRADVVLHLVEVDMIVPMYPRNEPRGILQLVLAGVVCGCGCAGGGVGGQGTG